MTTITKTGSALLALTMAFAVQATTVSTSIVGATALSVVTANYAEAGQKRQIKKALKQIDKALAAERAGDAKSAVRHYDKANNHLEKAANKGVMAGPGCDAPHVLC